MWTFTSEHTFGYISLFPNDVLASSDRMTVENSTVKCLRNFVSIEIYY